MAKKHNYGQNVHWCLKFKDSPDDDQEKLNLDRLAREFQEFTSLVVPPLEQLAEAADAGK